MKRFWDKDDNMKDKATKGRARNGGHCPIGEQNGRAKLLQKDILQIRLLYQNGYTQSRIANQYGVHHTTIGRIVRGERWSSTNKN